MDWIAILGYVFGGSGLIGTVSAFLSRNGRKRDRADADSKIQEAQQLMIANYEERIKELHSNIQKLNDLEKTYIERITEQDKAIDSKTEQIRNLTQKMWESEQELNVANERITVLTKESEKYKMWQCRSSVCVKGNPDPEGRQPPNPKLLGQTFN